MGTYSPVDIYTDEKTNLYLGAYYNAYIDYGGSGGGPARARSFGGVDWDSSELR